MQLHRYRSQSGTRTALLVTQGPKWIQVITMDAPIAVRKIPASEARWMTPIEYTGRRRRPENAFLAAGRFLGITGRAKALLKKG